MELWCRADISFAAEMCTHAYDSRLMLNALIRKTMQAETVNGVVLMLDISCSLPLGGMVQLCLMACPAQISVVGMGQFAGAVSGLACECV